jgi:hypothetical protein
MNCEMITIKKRHLKILSAIIVLLIGTLACILDAPITYVTCNSEPLFWETCTYRCQKSSTGLDVITGGDTLGYQTGDDLEKECAAQYPKDYATPTPTAIPQPSPTARPPVVLGNIVSSCDPTSHAIKLSLADGYTAAMFTSQSPTVTMGGQTVQCTANDTDHTLDCTYPSSIIFPTQIQVNNGGAYVNGFSFDGAACTPPPAPILTGDILYCDGSAHVMNLRLTNGYNPRGPTPQVTLGGVAMDCSIDLSNQTLLTCTYPASATFPANIQVMVNGITVNQFTYDGAACQTPVKNTKKVCKFDEMIVPCH